MKKYYAIFDTHEELYDAYHQIVSGDKINFKLHENKGKNALCRVLGAKYVNDHVIIKTLVRDNILGDYRILLLRKDPIAAKVNKLIDEAFELVSEHDNPDGAKLLCKHIEKMSALKISEINLKKARRSQ